MGGKNSKAKQKTVPENQKAPVRKHTYEEIDDEDLAASQREHDQAQSSNHNNATPPVTSTTNNRHHPYDEVTEEQLNASREAVKKKPKKNSKKGKESKTKRSITKTPIGKSDIRVTSEPDSVEYQNVSSVQPSECNDSIEDDQHISEGGDLYALPAKKTSPAKQLNYIEVEFNKSPTTEVKPKITHTPTNYTNVINDNGKVILLTES